MHEWRGIRQEGEKWNFCRFGGNFLVTFFDRGAEGGQGYDRKV